MVSHSSMLSCQHGFDEFSSPAQRCILQSLSMWHLKKGVIWVLALSLRLIFSPWARIRHSRSGCCQKGYSITGSCDGGFYLRLKQNSRGGIHERWVYLFLYSSFLALLPKDQSTLAFLTNPLVLRCVVLYIECKAGREVVLVHFCTRR